MKRNFIVLAFFRYSVAFGVFFLFWMLLTQLEFVPPYLIPTPATVLARLSGLFAEGVLVRHTVATLEVVIAGLFLGATLGVLCGFLVARSRFFANHVLPLIVAAQSVPLVAFAPLFLLWFGGGFTAKVAVATLIVLFPVFTGTAEGIKKDNLLLSRLFYSLGASRLDRWIKLRLPLALPHLYAGAKTSVPLALVGATVGEFLGTDEGLGFLLQSGVGLFDTPLVFGVLLVLASMGLLLYGVTILIEKVFLERFFYN